MTDTKVVLRVVLILGVLAGVGLGGLIYLTNKLVDLVVKLTDDNVALFAAVIGAVAVVGTLTGTVVGGITGMLISTRSGDTAGIAKAEGKAEAAAELTAIADALPADTPPSVVADVNAAAGPVDPAP